MSFIRRRIVVKLALNGDTFDGSNDTLELDGLRCRATVQSTIGGITPYQGQLNMRLEGMLGSDMAKLSTLGLTSGVFNRNRVAVYAGDDQAGLSLVFSGAIFAAYVDYNSMPNVGIQISASETQAAQLPSIAASSYKGSMSVATMLQGVASSAGLSFVNAGVTAVLSNHAVGGSAYDQISDICQAALIQHDIRDNTLTIWPTGGSRDDVVIQVGPENGMVGYPMYSAQGVDIQTLFNPDILLGRQLTVTSSIPAPGASSPVALNGVAPPGANGTFYVFDVVHELSSNMPGGPWFTYAKLGTINTQVRAS